MDIQQHLISRGLTDFSGVYFDQTNCVVHFLLYNLSGQLVGHQKYSPLAEKTRNNIGRYITYVVKEGPKTGKIAVYGLQSLKLSDQYLFITEGIFDAVKIHNAGFPCVAVLQNNPKMFKSWFPLLPQKLIVIADDDGPGRKLIKFGDVGYTVPAPYHDLGDMPQTEVNEFVDRCLSA